ncbi:hypothetical protein [Pseudonocardia parietis]|uniref:PE family protein n=1 Tax=Pseudonocardia parietis TaxID=570936 RepID=A0ABS4W7I2_9PSEU|nr:hypothetical protein [Pseudonocardia parietis]MBP2371966.1 hypothetical protein [Pseudonocardia parietis]
MRNDEQARHHSELTQTGEQVSTLAADPPDALFVALDDDLAAVARSAVGAMSALRRNAAGELAGPAGAEISSALGVYLTELARLTRSALALHLAVESRLNANRD